MTDLDWTISGVVTPALIARRHYKAATTSELIQELQENAPLDEECPTRTY